jgi:hypothetical protein
VAPPRCIVLPSPFVPYGREGARKEDAQALREFPLKIGTLKCHELKIKKDSFWILLQKFGHVSVFAARKGKENKRKNFLRKKDLPYGYDI